MCLQKSTQFANFLKSATGHLLTCACRNPPSLQIFWNQPLTADLLKSACIIPPILQIFSNQPLTTDLLKSACRIPPHHLQIFLNQPLDIYWHVLAGILPQVCRFSQISHWTFAVMCLQKFPPRFAHFLKSASGHLLTCTCRIPPILQIFSNQPLTADLLISACRIPPPPNLQIFLYQPLDIYWHVPAEIPPICRFSQISQWTFTDMCLQKFCPGLQIFFKSATGHLLTCACR